ncbi:MAG: OmpA family protein, partial [Desulfamplus sp.]|nr:OmpA family protein [Desulfamplus sp.]
ASLTEEFIREREEKEELEHEIEQRRQEFDTRVASLTEEFIREREEKDELNKEIEVIREEIDRLNDEIISFDRIRSEMQSAFDKKLQESLTIQEELKAAREKLEIAGENLKTELKYLGDEKEELQHDYNSLAAEKDKLGEDYENLLSEKETLLSENIRLASENGRLAAEKGIFEKRISEIDKIRDELDLAVAENQSLKMENGNLEKQIRQIRYEKGAAEKKVEEKIEEYSTEIAQLQEMYRDKDHELKVMRQEYAASLFNQINFNSGGTRIAGDAIHVLTQLGEFLSQHNDLNIQVAGHADNEPISLEYVNKYPSNWELSAARAAAVINYLYSQFEIAPDRMELKAYSFHKPAYPNDTEDGRKKNRRVEIFLKPDAIQ